MNIKPSYLQVAVERGIVTEAQAAQLWALLQEEAGAAPAHKGPRFTVTHVFYYLGGLIAIGGMSLYVTLGWQRLAGVEIVLIAVTYAVIGYLLAQYLLETKGLNIPAGLLAAFVVTLTPLAVYGVQLSLGMWDARTTYRAYHAIIDGRWIFMELATLAVGAAMLLRFREPFLLMPVAVTLWYMSMDLAPILYSLLYGTPSTLPPYGYPAWSDDLWRLKQWVSVVFGLAVTAGALVVDLRFYDRRDFAFWLYLAGIAAFWGGLSSMSSDSELGKLLYCLLNVLMIFTGAVLGRRVFAVFGALGVAGYLCYLATRLFANSILFPLALTALGLGVVVFGVWWQRHESEIARRMLPYLPDTLRRLIESRSA
jgi:hypothetical protein